MPMPPPTVRHRGVITGRTRCWRQLSVTAQDESGALLAVNLYHHEPQGPSRRPSASASNHGALTIPGGAAAPGACGMDAAKAPSPRAVSAGGRPALTVRELDVCERCCAVDLRRRRGRFRLTVPTVGDLLRRALRAAGLTFPQRAVCALWSSAADALSAGYGQLWAWRGALYLASAKAGAGLSSSRMTALLIQAGDTGCLNLF